MSGRVLLVDDDANLTSTLELGLAQRGYRVVTAQRAEVALAQLNTEDVDVVLTDLNMPGLGGLEFAERVAQSHPDTPLIVLTGFGSYESAVAAIRAGAYDFLSKPAKLDSIVIALERAIQHRNLRREVARLRTEASSGSRFEGLVAASEAMQRALDLVSRVSSSQSSVLITGESGTGKEVLARAIHARSGRSGPFVAVNCAAMPETLLESELFGHVRGAFTDARENRVGLFTEANGGTLLLDEIGDMPLGLQPKLLRVLQERKVRPLGARAEHSVDVRIIAATNRDLEARIEKGEFREDLFFRINVVHVPLPPLRERSADILPLAQRFLKEFATRAGKTVKGLSAPAAARLLAWDWPGNVRELSNVMERAVALTRYDEIGVDDLPEKLLKDRPASVVVAANDPSELVTLEELEKRYILRVLEAQQGNKTAAARTLGIERKTLYRKLESWGVSGKD
ncbi:MAG: sigma-54-dependent Fis family transcriptional regulator [Archangium gephyra]|uniref:Sigma-54-dependent Fis family transcriptional regulator n=1 Tax=Archangium gephyra TaxID=48 RepID=A0A2W5TDC6_9BACT|nr:MAG: sigma-54-dependent Fis family transcriptional regulator [Archangium gephyra]